MEWIKGLIIGTIIGGGMILPGVSGAVLSVVLGVYEKIINAILTFFKDWRQNTLFLSPIAIGIILGAILFGKVLLFVFNDYPMEAGFTFIGLILGGIPILFLKIKKHDNKKVNTLMFAIAFIFSLTLFVLGKNTINLDFYPYLDDKYIGQILLFITGLIYISGKIIPGISGSFLLMLIGMYKYLLGIISHPLSLTKYEILQLVPMGFGAVIGAIILVNLMGYLIKHHHNATYSAIIGFVLGSIAAIYPGFYFNNQGFTSIILFMIAFIISYTFSLENKDKIT